MNIETERPHEGFILGRAYQFNPPIITNCIFLDGKYSPPKQFCGGYCVRFEPEREVYMFQGKPVGSTAEHYFFVRWGEGSVAHVVAPPRLCLIQGGVA